MTHQSEKFHPAKRLRSKAKGPPFHVVLVEPEIPPNTGNIARLCAATTCELHLVHPLGFQVDEKAVRRAGLDYWHLVTVHEHKDWTSFEGSIPAGSRMHFFTGKASRNFLQANYLPGDFLVFGKESTGLPLSLLEAHQDELVAIPTLGGVRSLNLANSVTLGIYEALRQTGQLDEANLDA